MRRQRTPSGWLGPALTAALALAAYGCDLGVANDEPPPPAPRVLAPAARFGLVVQRPDGSRQLVDPSSRAVLPIEGPDGAALTWVHPLPGAVLAVTPRGVLRASAGDSLAWDPAPLFAGPGPPRIRATDATGDTMVLDRATGDSYGVVYELFRRSAGSTRDLGEVAYPGGAAVSSDGAAIVVSGTPAPCPSLSRCPMFLWRVDESGGLARIPTRDDRAAYKPQLIDTEGQRWLVYQTTAYDDSAECAASLNRCRHDIVRRRFPDGAEEPIARAAIAFASGPVGRRAWLTHDAADCADITCETMRLHVIDSAFGDRVIDERAGSLAPTGFSPDGAWLAYRDRTADETVVVHLGTLVRRSMGVGAPIGWMQMPAGAGR